MSVKTLKKEVPKDKTSLIDFSATWCAPCKQLSPIFEALSKEIKASFYKVDIDKEPTVTSSPP